MAFPTDMKDQVTDSITDATTQANTKVLGEAPAVSVDTLLEPTKQALENAAYNAQHHEGNSTVTEQAATTEGMTTLYEVDTATSEYSHQIYDSE